MPPSQSIGEEPEVFAHHVRALRARQRRADDEANGGFLSERIFARRPKTARVAVRRGRSSNAGRDRSVDFNAARPLTRRDRQTAGIRVPHFDVKAVVAIHPPSRNGVGHPRFGGDGMSAAAHFYM